LFLPWESTAPIACYGDQPMTTPRRNASPTELKWLLPACPNFQFPVTTTGPQKTQPQQHHRRQPQKRPQHPHHYHKNSTTPQKDTTTNTPHHDQRTATKTQKKRHSFPP